MTKALAVGVVPFLPGGVLKCLGAAFIYRFLTVRGLLPV
jgi:biotin transporter BioY